jgi:prepilin-type processing-associated H-X9-DG protein
MKPRYSNRKRDAITLIEVLLVIVVLFVLASMFLPVFAADRRRAERVNCISNLNQISRAYGFQNHSDQPVPLILATNNGSLWIDFSAVSNVVKMPKALHCPADEARDEISYFFNLDWDSHNSPRPILGDDNFAVGDPNHPPKLQPTDNVAEGEIPVKRGLLEMVSNTPIAWSEMRHMNIGNVAFADGSVSEAGIYDLQQAFQQTGLLTNRLAIP